MDADGRLLLVARQSIGVTDAALTVIEPLATLDDPVHSLAASPDGTRIALAMAGHVWVMFRNLVGDGATAAVAAGHARNCFAANAHAMRDASGPSPSLKGWLAAPPLHACASPPTATSVATVVPLRLKSVTDIG